MSTSNTTATNPKLLSSLFALPVLVSFFYQSAQASPANAAMRSVHNTLQRAADPNSVHHGVYRTGETDCDNQSSAATDNPYQDLRHEVARFRGFRFEHMPPDEAREHQYWGHFVDGDNYSQTVGMGAFFRDCQTVVTVGHVLQGKEEGDIGATSSPNLTPTRFHPWGHQNGLPINVARDAWGAHKDDLRGQVLDMGVVRLPASVKDCKPLRPIPSGYSIQDVVQLVKEGKARAFMLVSDQMSSDRSKRNRPFKLVRVNFYDLTPEERRTLGGRTAEYAEAFVKHDGSMYAGHSAAPIMVEWEGFGGGMFLVGLNAADYSSDFDIGRNGLPEGSREARPFDANRHYNVARLLDSEFLRRIDDFLANR